MIKINDVIDYNENVEKAKEKLRNEIENLKLVKEYNQKIVDIFIIVRESTLDLIGLFNENYGIDFNLGSVYDRNRFKDKILQINQKLLMSVDIQNEVLNLFKKIIDNR